MRKFIACLLLVAMMVCFTSCATEPVIEYIQVPVLTVEKEVIVEIEKEVIVEVPVEVEKEVVVEVEKEVIVEVEKIVEVDKEIIVEVEKIVEVDKDINYTVLLYTDNYKEELNKIAVNNLITKVVIGYHKIHNNNIKGDYWLIPKEIDCGTDYNYYYSGSSYKTYSHVNEESELLDNMYIENDILYVEYTLQEIALWEGRGRTVLIVYFQ